MSGRLNTAAFEIVERVMADGGFVWEAATAVCDELGLEQQQLLVQWMRGTLRDQAAKALETREWMAGMP